MRKLTHEQFMEKFYKQNTHAQDIEILRTYENNYTKILCRCKIDGYEWEPTPKDLLRGHGCPKCKFRKQVKQRTKTHEQFIDDLAQVNKDIEVLGTYKNSFTKIKVRCKICGHIWKPTPTSLLNKRGCPKCGRIRANQKETRTHDEFIQQLEQVTTDIEVLETYKGAKAKIKVRCKIDGHIWQVTPNSLLQGQGCPKCGISKGEKRVAQYLDNIGINYIYNKCYFKDLFGVNGGLMQPDFIIPHLKIWIEYDGIQHFKPQNFKGAMSEQEVQELFIYTQQNDQIKNQYAEQHNWILIRIPYYDYDNIEQILDAVLKQEQVI